MGSGFDGKSWRGGARSSVTRVRTVRTLAASLCLFSLLLTGPVAAAQDWQAQERACQTQCTPFPRFSGVETDAEHRDRMRRQYAHDQCFLRCAHRSSSGYAPSFTPIDAAAKAYYRRNGVKAGK